MNAGKSSHGRNLPWRESFQGHVAIPHGFGLVYDGKKYKANLNRLTKNTNRDWFGTPFHRYVPCRVEAVLGVWSPTLEAM